MVNSVDPKFRPWKVIRKEFERLDAEDSTDITRRRDSPLCLTHGFHHQKTYSFKDIIRCAAFRNNATTEEFITNQRIRTSNIFQVKSFRKHSMSVDAGIDADEQEESCNFDQVNKFHINTTSPLHHLSWLPKFRVFVGIGRDENMRVFADTPNRCQPLSTPTSCGMPVLCMVHLEETDEVVLGGIGVIQPWKMRLSNAMQLMDTHNAEKQGKKQTKKRGSVGNGQGIFKSDTKRNTKFGQGQQMLQPGPEYRCDLTKEDWVLSMRVYSEAKTKCCVTGGPKNVLVATSASAIVAIDYRKREQLWSVRLLSSFSLMTDEKLLNAKKAQSEVDCQPLRSNYVIKGHVSLTACEFFPRYGYFITGGGEGNIQIMHMVNFGSVTTLIGHRLAVTALVAHNKLPILISSSQDGSIRIWCLETFRENQRIDTGQCIENISLSENRNFFYFMSKRTISMYYYENLYTLYSVPHSTPATLCPIKGDAARSYNDKILAALSDGSVAILSPVTGLMITMIYPMTTFQIFSDMAFDIYNGMCYISLQNGSVLQCDCTTNPSTPLQCFVPAMSYDEDVCCLVSVKIESSDEPKPITAVLAGLRNGQIVLIRPNTLWMNSVQAQAGPVRFLQSILHADMGKEDPPRDEQVISVGASSMRIWNVYSAEFSSLPQSDKILHHHGKIAKRLLVLQPVRKVLLPTQALNPIMVATFEDRACLAKENGQLIVLEFCIHNTSISRRYSDDEYENLLKYLHDDDARKKDFANFSLETRIRLEQALERNRKSMELTHKTKELVITLKNESRGIHTHHHQDDHSGKITALASASALRVFASAGEDGYVKLWDESNRLIRELCFVPSPITGICFVEGRNLLVALEGRIYAIECSKFLPTHLITERRLADLHFDDMKPEGAFTYDDDTRIVSNIELLPTTQLIANARISVADEDAEKIARKHTLHGQNRDGEVKQDAGAKRVPSPKTQAYFRQLDEEIMKRKKKLMTGYHPGLATVDERWVDTFSRISTKIRRGSIAMFTDEAKVAEFVTKRKSRNKMLMQSDIEAFLKSKFPLVAQDDESAAETKEKKESVAAPKETSKNVKDEKKKRLFVPGGYIPNSVVRKVFKPKPPTPEIQFVVRKFSVESEELIEWSMDAPRRRKRNSKYDHDISAFDFGSILNLPDDGHFIEESNDEESLRQKYEYEKCLEEYGLHYDDSLNDLSDDSYLIYTKGRPVDKGITIRKLGNTLKQHDEDNRLFKHRGRRGKGRVPKYRAHERSPHGYNMSQEHDEADEKEKMILLRTSSSSSEMMETADSGERAKHRRRRSHLPADTQTSAEMKAKLLKQQEERRQPKEVQKKTKPIVHPLLEEIAHAPWFRVKLPRLTAEAVAIALLQLGNTTRIGAHRKVCADLTKLLNAFGPDGSDRSGTDNILSDETVEKIRNFIASFLTPKFSLSGVEDEGVVKKMRETEKETINRIALAHHALDSIDASGQGFWLSEQIETGVIRLCADENEGLRKKAMEILMNKFGIDTWEKLAAKLKDMLGTDVILPPEAHSLQEKDALLSLLRRLKQGMFTLANAPRLAERLRLMASKRRISNDDDDDSQSNLSRESLGKARNQRSSSKERTSLSTGRDAGHVADGDGNTSKRPLSDSSNKERSGTRKTKDFLKSGAVTKKESAYKIYSDDPRSRNFGRNISNLKTKTESPQKIRYESQPFVKFPRINWRKAVPESSKKTIKMMRTMKTVQHAVRLQQRRPSKAVESAIEQDESTESSSTSTTTEDEEDNDHSTRFRLPKLIETTPVPKKDVRHSGSGSALGTPADNELGGSTSTQKMLASTDNEVDKLSKDEIKGQDSEPRIEGGESTHSRLILQKLREKKDIVVLPMHKHFPNINAKQAEGTYQSFQWTKQPVVAKSSQIVYLNMDKFPPPRSHIDSDRGRRNYTSKGLDTRRLGKRDDIASASHQKSHFSGTVPTSEVARRHRCLEHTATSQEDKASCGKPMSFYQIKGRSLKKLLATQRNFNRQRLKLPKIQAKSPLVECQSPGLQSSSFSSSLLCATPFDIKD